MSNLIAEQRPDKNGNVVTRWVRGIFGNQAKESRPIPKVALSRTQAPKGHAPLSVAERNQLFGRVMGKTEIVDASGKLSIVILDRQIIQNAFNDGDDNALHMMDRFGKTHGFSVASEASAWMEKEGLEGELPGLTGEQLDAYKSFSSAAMLVSMRTPGENGKYMEHLKIAPVFCHVLMHPQDGPRLERIISDGVFDTQRTFEMLEQIEEGILPVALSDGFL